MTPGNDDNFLDELGSLEAPRKGKPASGNRLRVTGSMVSLRYRFKQLWKNAGIELLLVIILFFSLRQVLTTSGTPEESRQIAAQSLELARGNLSLKNRPEPATLDAAARIAWHASLSETTLLPLALVTLVTGGGSTVLTIVSLLVAALTLLAIYAAGKELFSPETGIAAALVMAILPGFIAPASGLFTISFAYAYAALGLWLLARSRRVPSLPCLLTAGAAMSSAIHAEPLFIFLPFFLALHWIETKSKWRNIGLVVGGFVAAEVVIALLMQLTASAPPLGSLAGLFAPTGLADAGGYLRLADLFEQLFTDPQVLPFGLLSVFAIGYTLRASKSSFPYMPMLLFAATYFVLEFLPVSLSPYTTLPKDERLLAAFTPALALLLGTFIAGMSNRTTLRWLLGGLNVLALPLLILY